VKPKTTLILFIVAVLIGVFLWVDHKFFKETKVVEEQAKRLFKDLKSSDITRLDITNTNGLITVEKAGDKWNMKKPFDVRASKSEVDSILTDLEFLDSDRVLTPKDLQQENATLASYGLEKPRIEATFIAKGGTNTIRLGNESKLGDKLYASVAGRPEVYVIAKTLAGKLGKTVDDLRDRSVVEFNAGELTKLELKAGTRQIELTKTENAEDDTESWRITRPINARASKDRITGIADKLAGLKVDTFVTEDPKDLKLYGLDEPAQEATLFTKGTEGAKIVQFGGSPTNDTTKTYAKRKGANSVYLVKNDILTNLIVQVNDLRDRTLVEFETDQVKAVDLVLGSQKVLLSQQPTNDWHILEPAKFKAENSVCDDLVSDLHGAQIKEFVADVVTDLAPYGLDKPGFELTLKKEKVVTVATTSAPPKEATGTNTVVPVTQTTSTTNLVPFVTIQVGKTDAAKALVYVKRADEAFVYGLETNFVADLPTTVLDLRDRHILSLDSSTIHKLEITRGAMTFAAEKVTVRDTNQVERQEWKLLPPTQGVLGEDAVEDAITALGDIKAVKLVAENPVGLAPYGLEPAALTATFTSIAATNAPAQTHTLLVGKETPDKNRFAMLKGGTLVFELANSEFEKLASNFVTRPEEKPATTNAPPAAAK
jgi:hypothetical protein